MILIHVQQENIPESSEQWLILIHIQQKKELKESSATIKNKVINESDQSDKVIEEG